MSFRIRAILFHSLALVMVGAFLLPLFWMVVASVRPPGVPQLSVDWWPAEWRWENYRQAVSLVPMGRYAINSLVVVAVAVPLTLLTASLAAFGLVHVPEPWQARLVLASIALLMIPAPAVWLFRFQLLRWFGLLDSLWALIVPAFAASNPVFVLLFYWNFRRFPPGQLEAPQLEGDNALAVWWRIALPQARPTVAAATLLAFVLYWSDFVSPVVYLLRPETYTLPVGLQILKQLDATNWPILMAGATVLITPIVLLLAWLQRYFLRDAALTDVVADG